MTPAQAFTYALPAVAAGGVAFAGVAYVSVRPASRAWGPVLTHGSPDGPPRYALTFDDGPTPGATDRILDTLRDLRVRAAFFVVGVNVQRAPDLLRRVHDEGHLVGNHSYHHSHYGMMRGPHYWRRELRRTDDLIESIIGRRPATFRPPMGVKTPFIHRAARRAGQPVVTWNRRALDGVETTADRILDRLVPATRPGDVLLLHDGIEPNRRRDPAPSVAAVRPLVERLRARGLEPARLDALLGIPPYACAATASASTASDG
jgi:peptidoglycan/xylan/chitin deacetylase (PgdA/CDA1 family)